MKPTAVTAPDASSPAWRRGLTWRSLTLGVSVVVGLVASVAFLLAMAYGKGGANFGSWTFRPADGMGDRCFGMAVRGMTDPRGTDWGRVGGVRLYRRAAPFFLGLVLGCFTGIALSQVVDAIWFTGRGHFIYNG